MTDWSQRHLALAKEFAEAIGRESRLEMTSDLGQMNFGGEDEGALVYLFLPDAVEVRHRVVDWPLPSAPVMTTELWRRFRSRVWMQSVCLAQSSKPEGHGSGSYGGASIAGNRSRLVGD